MMASESAYLFSEFTETHRKAAGLSVEELAEKAGLSTSTVRKAVNCTGGMHWDSVRKILAALNVDLVGYAVWERDLHKERKLQ